MKTLAQAFAHTKALIPYVSAGDPDLATTAELLQLLDREGADILEVGIPFSDPLADGPVIQRAGQRALAGGATLKKILEMLAGLRDRISAPRVLMGYMNPIISYGPGRFAADAECAGVAGVIVPDLPFHQSDELASLLRDRGIDLVLMVTPNTTPLRLKAIAERASGFVYCVSRLGVTGESEGQGASLEEYTDRVRAATSLPLALGFGVNGPERARAAARAADGVVVGSALISLLEPCGTDVACISDKAKAFIGSLREAIRNI
jgi:tryptophan synthase alpha chain